MKSFSGTRALTSALEIAFLAAGTTIAAGAFNPTIAVISSAGTGSAAMTSAGIGSAETGAIANNFLNNTKIAFSFSGGSSNGDLPSPASGLLMSHSSAYHIVEETIFDLLELPESMVTQDAKLQDLFAEAEVCDRQDTAQTTIRLLGILFEEFQVDLENEAVLADLNEVETVADLTNLVLKYGTY
ncbi:MAG: hypothetical protein F6J93_13740 [Oscillatoria sp. SIO1A7]|nr:hypothetical protein [Oscillatoria sp. SIO1A7]